MMRFRMILTIVIAVIGSAQIRVQIVVLKTGIFLRNLTIILFFHSLRKIADSKIYKSVGV